MMNSKRCRPGNRSLLVIVAKAPLAGQVKTRLCSELTPAAARDLYGCFLQDRIAEMSALKEVDLAVAYTPADAAGYFSRFAAEGFDLFPQVGRDLGERLHNIFCRKSAEGYDAVAIIDSDSPDLPHALVQESFQLLSSGRADAVFGPCEDGGYYLVGLRKPQPELFREIPWSTAGVLPRSLEIAAACELQTKLLRPWNDLDTFADLLAFYRKYKDRPPESLRAGARTFRHLCGLDTVTRRF